MLKSKELMPLLSINVTRNSLQYLLKTRTLLLTMNIKQTIRNLVLGGLLLIPITFFAASTPVAADCGGVKTAIINCSQGGGSGEVEETGLWGVLILTINILTAGVGVLAVAGFVYGGILYVSSGGSPDQVKKAKTVFTSVVVGVIAFGGMFTLLNFIVPGGIFR